MSKNLDVFKIFNLTLLLVQSETLDIMDSCEDKDIEVNIHSKIKVSILVNEPQSFGAEALTGSWRCTP